MKYVPFLKSKQGEMRALESLGQDMTQGLVPLIDVHRHLNPDKELEQHLESACGQIVRAWRDRLIVDLFDIDPSLRTESGDHPAHFVFDRLNGLGMPLIPCSGLDRDEAYNEQVKEALLQSNSVAIRLQREDIQAPTLSVPDLEELLEYFGVDSNNVILLLDLREIVVNPMVLASECAQFVDEVGQSESWEAIVLAGSSMPRSLSERIDTKSSGYISRSEIEVWNAVCGQASQSVVFGDYGIVNPEYIDLDPRIISNQMTPAIRYALDEEWYAVRGESFRKGGYEQYYELARDILGSGHYFGARFSFGDAYIEDKSNEVGGTGNATTWITAGLNHHIAATLHRLS